MENKEILFNKIREGLEGDDIILEIKIFNTKIEDWNKFLRLAKTKYDIRYFGIKKKNIDEIVVDELYFPQPPNYETGEFKIYFSSLELLLVLYQISTIEIFTDSVVRLSIDELSSLFDFIEYIGENLRKDIFVYVESTEIPIFSFKSGKWNE